MITFHDISYAQGSYNMAGDPNPVIFMKMSGAYYGSKVCYYDSQAANNYNNAIRTGKIPGLYHFAGGGNPVTEADFFVGAVSPLTEGDIYILDYGLTASMNPPTDPVNWCLQFTERVHQRTGTWCLFYTYASLLAEHDFSPVLNNCALWVADYGVSPDGTVPTGGHPYIIQQYTDNPIDTNALFISLDTLKKYEYHAPVAPAPAPQPAPAPSPAPTPPPEPTPVTPAPIVLPNLTNNVPTPVPTSVVVSSSVSSTPTNVPVAVPTPSTGSGITPAQSWISKLIDWLRRLFGVS